MKSLVPMLATKVHAAIDYVGYVYYVQIQRLIRWQTFFVTMLWVLIPALFLHFVFGTTGLKSTGFAIFLAVLHKLLEIGTPALKAYFHTSDKTHDGRVRTSVAKHLKLLQTIERKPTVEVMKPLSERSEKERAVLTDSIKLIDAVIRERLRPEGPDDVHTTLRVTDLSNGTSEYFYEGDAEQWRNGRDMTGVHDLIFAAAKICEGSNGTEHYKYSNWPLVTARRHMRALKLPHWYRNCDSSSALLVAIFTKDKNFDIDLLFESKHPYDFGSIKRNAKILRELVPFFVIIRIALQYSKPISN